MVTLNQEGTYSSHLFDVAQQNHRDESSSLTPLRVVNTRNEIQMDTESFAMIEDALEIGEEVGLSSLTPTEYGSGFEMPEETNSIQHMANNRFK